MPDFWRVLSEGHTAERLVLGQVNSGGGMARHKSYIWVASFVNFWGSTSPLASVLPCAKSGSFPNRISD